MALAITLDMALGLALALKMTKTNGAGRPRVNDTEHKCQVLTIPVIDHIPELSSVVIESVNIQQLAVSPPRQAKAAATASRIILAAPWSVLSRRLIGLLVDCEKPNTRALQACVLGFLANLWRKGI
jgi:hypothetical protein